MFSLWHSPVFSINVSVWTVSMGSAEPDVCSVPDRELAWDGNPQLSESLANMGIYCCDIQTGFSSAAEGAQQPLCKGICCLPVLPLQPLSPCEVREASPLGGRRGAG